MQHFCLYGVSRTFLTTCIILVLTENVDLPRRDVRGTRVCYPFSPLLTLPRIDQLSQKLMHITRVPKEAKSILPSVSNTNMADVLTCVAVSTYQHLIWGTAMTHGCGYWQWRTQEFFSGGGSTNLVEDRGQRERGSGGGSLVVRGSGGNCNLVQEISFHIVKFS